MKARVTLTVLLFVSLCLTGCGLSLGPIQAIVDATAAALPVLTAVGVPVPPQVALYVGDVAQCIGSLSGTPTPNQLTTVSTCLANQVAPQLNGLPKAVITIVSLVITDVQQFLVKAPAMQAQMAKRTLSPAQVSQIATMQTKARTTALTAHALVTKK